VRLTRRQLRQIIRESFDVINAEKTKLDPLFDAVFFCSVDAVKKALNYEPK